MASILQQLARRCSKWVAGCGGWEVGEWQAPEISGYTGGK